MHKYECTIDQELANAAVCARGRRLFSLNRWQHFSAWNDVMAAILNNNNNNNEMSSDTRSVPDLNIPICNVT